MARKLAEVIIQLLKDMAAVSFKTIFKFGLFYCVKVTFIYSRRVSNLFFS